MFSHQRTVDSVERPAIVQQARVKPTLSTVKNIAQATTATTATKSSQICIFKNDKQ